MNSQCAGKKGFTLLEMSIVLLIIALLISAVVIGQALIRSAQINSIINDQARYMQAINDFRDKYKALPGDMSNATAYWGIASGGCPLGARTGTQTCNGDGDGQISWAPATQTDNFALYSDPLYNYELYLVWQHLVDANMIPGKYTGLTGPGSGRNSVPGVNVPQSSVNNAGFTVFTEGSYTDGGTWPGEINPGTIMTFGSSYGGTIETYGPALTPPEAFLIDSKLDDGNPASGRIVASSPLAGFIPNCTQGTDPSSASYLVSTSITCDLVFLRILSNEQ